MMPLLSNSIQLGTCNDQDFNRVHYSPHTEWPIIPLNYLKLPDFYSFDLEQARFELQNLLEKFQLKAFKVGSKEGRERSRLSYRGLGLSARKESTDPLYDGLKLFGEGNQPLDIYQTFSNYSSLKPGHERTLEVLDESNFSELTSACTPFFKELISRFKSPYSKVRLLELMPGGIIPPHIDFPYYKGIRVHSVIETNPDVVWEVNGEQKKLPADGNFYWFDTGKYHAVVNRGKSPRLVLSINLLVYKNRDGSLRHSPRESLEDLISSGNV